MQWLTYYDRKEDPRVGTCHKSMCQHSGYRRRITTNKTGEIAQ